MTDHLRYSLTTDESDAANSLEGLNSYADLDVALVQLPNRYFRFFATSTEAPNGTSIIAPANITPPNPGRWILQGGPGPVGKTFFRRVATNGEALEGFDFFINSRADLVRAVGEPVAGVFTLQDGSYAQGADITLNAGERIEVPVGVEVFWMSLNAQLTMTPTAAPGITVDGNLTALYLDLFVNGDNNVGVDVSATGQFEPMGGDVTMASATGTTALQIGGGNQRLVNWTVGQQGGAGAATGVALNGGELFASAIRVSASGVGLLSDGILGSPDRVRVVGSQIISSAESAVSITAPLSSWAFDGSRLEGGAVGSACVLLGDAAAVRLHGCDLICDPADIGLEINGDIDDLQVIGGSISGATDGIAHQSGTVGRANVVGVDLDGNSASAILWAAASVPTDGLSVIGCTGVDTLIGFDEFSPRVNLKGNLQAGNLRNESLNVGEPPSLIVTATGTQQDWVPGGDAEAFDECRVLLLDTGGGGNLTIGGLAAPISSKSRRTLTVIKRTADDSIIASDDDGGSAVTNQIKVAAAGDTLTGIDTAWILNYAESRWRVVSTLGAL